MKFLARAACVALVSLLLCAPAPCQGAPVDGDVARAAKLIRGGSYDEAVEVIEGLLARDPSEPWAWFQLGMAHHSAGRLDEALRGHMLALHSAAPRGQLRATASYNIACVHALQGRREHAFQWLHRARLAGFSSTAGLLADTDLEGLREDPRFEALGRGFGIGSVAGASIASLGTPSAGGTGGVTCGPDGTLYIADFADKVWRQRPGGELEVLAAGFTKPAGCVLEPDGSLIQADFQTTRVWRIAPDGDKQDLGLEGLKGPVGITRAEDGTLYLVDFVRRAVLRVPPGGQPEEIVAGGLLKGPNGICLAPGGELYVCNYEDGAVLRVSAAGELTFVAELPGGGNGHLVWNAGALYVTARRGNAVYRVTPDGTVALVVGSGNQGVVDGAGAAAQLALPNGIALGPDGGTLFVNDQASSGTFQLRAIALPQPAD